MSSTIPPPNAILYTGSLVIIDGLKSEVGKKLNGGRAIILNPAKVDEGGVTRYPVCIYAQLNDKGILEALAATVSHKMKEENLQADPLPPTENKQLIHVAHREAEETVLLSGKRRGDIKKQLLWVELYHKACPDNMNLGVSYANLLRGEERIEEAISVLEKYNVDDMPTSEPNYGPRCNVYSATYLQAGKEKLDLALGHALKIPHDTKANKKLSNEAINWIVRDCNKLMCQHENFENQDISRVYIKSCLALIEQQPDNMEAQIGLARAYCLAGSHLEGARQYRKVLKAKKLPPREDRSQIRQSLVLAQLQCPGMPLEQKCILSIDQSVVQCIAKEDHDKLSVQYLPNGQTLVNARNDAIASIIKYNIPSDSDDPAYFSPALLAQFSD